MLYLPLHILCERERNKNLHLRKKIRNKIELKEK